MLSYQNHIIEIFHDDELRFFFVEKMDKGQLHIVDRHGKRNRINENRIVFLFPHAAESSNAPDVIDAIREEIDRHAEGIDARLLWETIDDFDREYTIDELAALYFNDPSVVDQAALYGILREDRLLFKRKGTLFFPRKQRQIDEILLQEARDREKKEKSERQLNFFKSALASKTDISPDPDMMQMIHDMKIRLYQHRQEMPEQLLQGINPHRELGSMIYEVLRKTGVIDAKDNRFLTEAGIPDSFSPELEATATGLPNPVKSVNRIDFSHLNVLSIDDESTREVDDALSLERTDNGFKLGVHIADVSAWIQAGSALDREAMRRVTSIYLETGVVLMFPENLSCDRMSLKAGELRTALSLIIDCRENGEMISHEFSVSTISVKNRLSYEQADVMLKEGKDDPISNDLAVLQKLSNIWKKNRLDAGAVEINKPEFNLEVQDDNIVLKIYDRLSPSRKMVSECMILFNRLVAQFAVERDIPMIYRAQEPAADVPRELQERYDPVLNDQIMRLMRPGRVTTIPLPHGGLGVDAYTQITSPIRRYADLVLQRQITAALLQVKCPYSTEELFELLASIEENEKLIRDVYQKSRLYWLIRYFETHRREDVFPAMVVNTNQRQAVMEILELGYRIVIPGSNQYKAGQVVPIRIKKLNADEGVLGFEQAQTN